MKLLIRFADKVVGSLIILALGILIFVIFMLGTTQRWFSRDYNFVTYFSSASGLSQNMPVQYKGFTIGNVKSIQLDEDDRVEVGFTIFDTYIDRVKTGSLVEIILSPVAGLGGNQFVFHPGLGNDPIPEGEVIPAANSTEGKRLLALGLADRPEDDDGINVIMLRVGVLLGTVNDLLLDIQEAFEGTTHTSLGRIILDVEGTLAGVRQAAEILPYELEDSIVRLMDQVEPALASVRTLTERAAEPDSSVMALLDAEGDVFASLALSLDAVSGILQNLERTTDFVPAQLPQVAALLADLHITLLTAQDVLISLTNNPLLRGGVPQRVETRVGGTHSRDLEF